MMTGSPEQMQCIQDEGKLDDWCRDSLDWLRKEVGNENVVSAVLHMDEQTPHIHATVVPIVTGERRKARQEAQKAGKKYKKKNINAPRLCADDIMSKERFTHMQNTYAQAMSKFGLVRGKEGSEARHISTSQYYRDLVDRNEDLKEIIQEQEHERQEVYDKTRDLYDRKDEAREKFLNMDRHVRDKQEELATVESKLQKAKQNYEPYKAQEELNLIHNLFPIMKEQLRIADFCKQIGLAVNSIRALLEGRNLTAKTFSFFSPEHKQKFTAEDVKLKMEKEPDNPDKLRLNLNGQNIVDWFREQYQRVKQATSYYARPTIKPEAGKNKGIKL
jgi:DNA-binding transcriptional MerR regulator